MKVLKILTTTLIFISLFFEFFHTISAMTQDLGRHLLMGKIIFTQHAVPKINLFSYTYPDFPFINHHWLSEVIFYLTSKVLGLNGLFLLNLSLALSSFGLIFLFYLKKANIAAFSLISFLYLGIILERTDIRPEMFSFLLLSIFLIILYRYKKGFTNWIFALVPLEILWVNMHIYFPIGIVTMGIFLIDIAISNFKKFNSRYTGILVLVFIASILATLINPNGLIGALYPFNVFQNYGYSIEENQNVFFLWQLFGQKTILYFFASVFILAVTLFVNIKNSKIIDWLLTIVFAILAAVSIRNFPLFALATFIPFIQNLSLILNKIIVKKSIQTLGLITILLILFFSLMQTVSSKTIGFGVESGAKNGVDFFIKNNLKGPIFNNFDIGSYLEYRLYPKEKVFVDGRPEAYPSSFFQNIYIPMQQNEDKFKEVDNKYHFQTIFFSHTDQTPWAETFLKQISQSKKWNMVYLDDFSVIWTKEKNIKTTIKTDYSDIKSLIQLAHFFQNTNFADQEIKIYQNIINIDPTSCPALHNLALKLQNKNDPSSSIFTTKFQQNCH